jgi:hypothetical protein
MALVTFAQSQSFPTGTTDTASVLVPANIVGAIVTVSAGPMSNAATHFTGTILVDKQDGAGFVEVGVGLESWGGMSSSTKGGPLDTPVTPSAGGINMPLTPGWRIRAHVVVVNGPVPASISANTY